MLTGHTAAPRLARGVRAREAAAVAATAGLVGWAIALGHPWAELAVAAVLVLAVAARARWRAVSLSSSFLVVELPILLLLFLDVYYPHARTATDLAGNPLDAGGMAKLVAVGLAILIGGLAFATSTAAPRPTNAPFRLFVLYVVVVFFGVWSSVDPPPASPLPSQIQGVYPMIASNGVGTLGVILALWSLARLVSTSPRERMRRPAAIALTALGVATLLAAQYRTGYAAFGAGVALLLAFRGRKTLAAAIGLFAAVAMYWGLATLGTSTEPLLLRGDTPERASQLSGRLAMWHAAIPFWQESPIFGRGLLTSTRLEVLPSIGLQNTATIHGTWIETLVGTGLVGTALLAAALVLLLYRGVADQALSSVVNLAVGALVARALSPASFGAFGLAFSTYLIVLGACRALVAEPLVARFSARDDADWGSATRAATGAALALGIFVGVGCVLAGLASGGVFGEALLALGVVLPGLVLQDTWRFAFFAAGRGRQAFVNDLAAAGALPALAALSETTHMVGLFVLAWGAAGTCAALVGALQARLVPTPIAGLRWIRDQRDLAFPYLGEFAALGAGEAALFGVAGLAGLAAAGALRPRQILVGPLGVRLAAVPEGVRLLRDARSSPRAAAVRLSAGLASVALAWGALLTLLPPSLGESLVGRSWGEARHVMVPLSLAMAGTGAVTGAVVGLRALAAAGRSLLSRVLVTPFMVGATIAGAAAAGAPGTAWAIAAVTWLSLGLWWRQFLGALAERRPADAAGLVRVPLRRGTAVGPRA